MATTRNDHRTYRIYYHQPEAAQPYLPYLSQHYKRPDEVDSMDRAITGVEIRISYDKGRGVSLSFHPASGTTRYMIDGTNLFTGTVYEMARFNQAKFDAVADAWLPRLPHLATLYLLTRLIDYYKGRSAEWRASLPNIYSIAAIEIEIARIAKLLGIEQTPSVPLEGDDLDAAPAVEEPAVETTDPVSSELSEETQPAEQPDTTDIFVTTCDGTDDERRIVERFRNSLRNGGRCIYNMSGGAKHNLPAIYQTSEVIHSIREGYQFDGWEGFKRLTMFDYSAMHEYRIAHNGEDPAFDCDQLLSMTISDEMNREFGQHLEDFHINDDDCSAVFIRVDLEDGTFFEYIISDTNAA